MLKLQRGRGEETNRNKHESIEEISKGNGWICPNKNIKYMHVSIHKIFKALIIVIIMMDNRPYILHICIFSIKKNLEKQALSIKEQLTQEKVHFLKILKKKKT